MIRINGVELNPAPTGYTVAIQDISQAERNAAGTMIIERICTKRKVSMTWSGILSSDEVSTLLNLASGIFFTVDYVDPQTNAINTGTFYCGDRTTDAITYKNGQAYWKGLKFDIIER